MVRFLLLMTLITAGALNAPAFAQAVENIFAPEFAAGKTEGERARAVVAYMDDYYERAYFSQGVAIQDMKGTGYNPYMRARTDWEKRSDSNGSVPDSRYWELYEEVRAERLSKAGAFPAANWVSFGPDRLTQDDSASGTIDANFSGRMIAVHVDLANNQTVWAGSATGGLWKSLDGGDQWEPVTDGIPVVGVSSIAQNPLNPDILLIGTGENNMVNWSLRPGIGVLKSEDGGLTWGPTSFSYPTTSVVNSFDMQWDPADSSRCYLAATNGLWLSTDAGSNWTIKLAGNATSIAVNAANPDTAYAGVNGAGVYRTTNRGVTWSLLGGGLPAPAQVHRVRLAICDASPEIVYASITNPANFGVQGLYKTTDGGNTWAALAGVPAYMCQPFSPSCQGWYNNLVGVSPVDPDRVIVGGVTLWHTDDGGANWFQHDITTSGPSNNFTGLTYVDQHDFAADPTNPNVFYVANDGGIVKSTNAGVTWDKKNDGLETGQFYTIASALTDTNFVIGGLQDHGLQRTDIAGGNVDWTQWGPGDGSGTLIHPANPDRIFGILLGAGHVKSTDGGVTSFSHNTGITEAPPFIAPQILDPQTPKNMFTASTAAIYRSTNRGTNWTNVLAVPNVLSLAIDQQNPMVVYGHAYSFSGGTHSMWRSDDGGTSWAGATSPGWRVEDLEADPNTEGILYAVRNSAFVSNPHVLRSDDFGVTWNDITGDLPDILTFAIAIDPAETDNLYLATDLGVWATVDGGISWFEWTDGMPVVYCRDIHFHPLDRTVRVGTHGRGAWKSKAISPVVTSVSDGSVPLATAALTVHPNAPNPFNPVTTVRYELREAGKVEISVLNPTGQRVKPLFHAEQSAGEHTVRWDGTDANGRAVRSGVYFLKVRAAGYSRNVKMVLAR